MAQLTMSRRSFAKTLAVTGAAAALGASTAMEPLQALAEGTDSSAVDIKHVRSCCRACGKVECGVWVTVQNNKVIAIEGDESAPQSRGHCCAKSQASMQVVYHPDRLRYPVKRTNPKGSDDPGWVRITLDEAFALCGEKLGEIKDKYGGQSIFVMCGTSRVWSLGPYQGMKQLFSTPNAHLAYQVCKGPRHFAGIMTDEMGSPWMEVEQEPKVYLQWGTAVEYSNYDTTNRTISDVAPHAKTHIDVDPRVTPLGKEADIWLPVRPGTDGALALGWMNWIIENEAYDDTMVRRWSNASFLFVEDKPWLTEGWLPEGNGGIDMKTKILTEADIKEGGKYQRFMVWDEANERLTYWDAETGAWEGEEHRIPTTGTWIHHPLTGLVADCWLPDQSHFADPETEADRFPDGSSECNPKGLPKQPALFPGEIEVELRDGKTYKARTVWDAFHDLTSTYDWKTVESITGVPEEKNVAAVTAYTTRVNSLHGNGGIHFQLATDQNGNSIQNCRILQLISCLTGNSDEPAGNRGSCKSQFDGNPGRSNMLAPSPYGDAAKTWDGRDYSLEEVASHMQDFVKYLLDNDSPLAERYGSHVPTDEEAIIIAKRMGGAMKPSQIWPNPKTIYERNAGEIDAERFPLNRYWSRWVDATAIWDGCLQNADVDYEVKETPYELHAGVCQSGDIMNMANITRAWDATKELDFFVDINLWFCPNNGNADVIFPCQHWTELDSTRVSQGAGGMFGCGCKAVEPPGETIYDPDWNVGMYKAMGVPWNTKDPDAEPAENLNFSSYDGKYDETPSYLWPNRARVLKDNVDAWKTEMYPDGPTWDEAKQWFQDHGWMDCREWHPERWGTYRRHEMGWRRQQGGFNLFPLVDFHPGFMTASGLIEVWSLVCEAYLGDEDRFPLYREPVDSPVATPELWNAKKIDSADQTYFMNHEYPDTLKRYPDNAFLMTTGSRQPVYFHSEHRQLPWCRELWPSPRVELNPNDAERLGLEQGDWVWIESPWGKVREVVDLYYGIKQGVVNANHAWWFPEFDTASHGFELVSINCIMNPYGQDKVCGAATMRSVPVVVYKATAENSPFGNPVPCDPNGNECIHSASDPRLKTWLKTGLRARVEGEPEWEE
ncbi:molybdopterin dinucleotide binding domain-containing protein [Slackia exigua]|uniref:molybdopterin-containing oxidoreductase family protein n=1 Tax=Slackia exigua TaxID=84109 RepID=UPI003AB9867F